MWDTVHMCAYIVYMYITAFQQHTITLGPFLHELIEIPPVFNECLCQLGTALARLNRMFPDRSPSLPSPLPKKHCVVSIAHYLLDVET